MGRLQHRETSQEGREGSNEESKGISQAFNERVLNVTEPVGGGFIPNKRQDTGSLTTKYSQYRGG